MGKEKQEVHSSSPPPEGEVSPGGFGPGDGGGGRAAHDARKRQIALNA